MVIDNAQPSSASKRFTEEEFIALRQAVKDCYCGLGPACYHWKNLSPEGRIACSCDKRMSAESYWKTGTVG